MKSVFEFRPITAEDLPVLEMAVMQGVNLDSMVGGERYLGWGMTPWGFGPIAVMDVKETPYVIEPHVTWLPWTTLRQRKEAFEWALTMWDKVVFLLILQEHCAFYDQFAKRGVIRKIGVLDLPEEAGSGIHMYQKIGEKHE